VAAIKALFATFKWMPSTFRDLLDGKRFLPDNKLRPNLLNSGTGFMGDGVYREHFFGKKSPQAYLARAIADQLRYSIPAIKWQRRRRARLADQ
jgi:tetracycline 7-halogenase / FADH2 O2-dependent halogenase